MSDSQSRRYLRRPVSVEFSVFDADEQGSGEILFDSVDLSEGGAFLRSELLLDQGQLIEVRFQLPYVERTISTPARVAWVARHPQVKGEAGMGIEFTKLDPSAREAIAEFIRMTRGL